MEVRHAPAVNIVPKGRIFNSFQMLLVLKTVADRDRGLDGLVVAVHAQVFDQLVGARTEAHREEGGLQVSLVREGDCHLHITDVVWAENLGF